MICKVKACEQSSHAFCFSMLVGIEKSPDFFSPDFLHSLLIFVVVANIYSFNILFD